METTTPVASSSGLHPMLWIAGIAVTLASLVGIASMTGLLPARTAPAPEPPAISAAAPAVPVLPAVAPVASPPPEPAVVAPQAPTVAANKAPAPSHSPTTRKKVEPVAHSTLPPPLAGAVPPDYVPPAVVPPAPPPCVDCGVIANVRQVTHEGQGSGAGAIIGGLAGGALGSNVGRGNTRTLASIAGAVGGGLLGNSIEKSQRKTVSYQVSVRMEDGTSREIDSESVPPWRIGDKVKLVGGGIVLR